MEKVLENYIDSNVAKIEGLDPLNLCILLKFYIGETFYSPTFGNILLTNIGIRKDYLSFSIPIPSINNQIEINPNGTLKGAIGGELCVFPSNTCRSWKEWAKENYSSINIWKDIEEQLAGKLETEKIIIEIQSLQKILEKIAILIKVGYGGIPLIGNKCFRIDSKFNIKEGTRGHDSSKLADVLCFKSRRHAARFISYDENKELIRELYF